MKKLRVALAVAVVAAFSVLASSPAQSQTYTEVTVTISERTVVGGHSILIEASVNPSSVDCAWKLTFLGVTKTGTGNSISKTFSTPEVDDIETHDAVAECTYDDGTNGALGSGGSRTVGTSLATVETTASATGTQTLLPRGNDDDGDDDGDGDGDDDGNGGNGGDNGGLLPNTGGERLAWLIIGGMLVLVGGGVVVASRRRDA